MNPPQYIQKGIGKYLNNSLKKEFANNLLILMSENLTYTKKKIVNIVIFSVSNNNFIEYSTKRLQDKKDFCPPINTVLYHLNKSNV